jgi:hypothetical protein
MKDLTDRLSKIHRRFVEQIRAFEQWLRTADAESDPSIES